MSISRCCKNEVFVITDYYACEHCGRPCDTINLSHLVKDYYDDARNQVKVEDAFIKPQEL